MSEELVTVHFAGITHIDMTYGLAVQQMQKHIDTADAQIAALTEKLRAVEAERDEVYKLLVKETPGGSEFFNDPVRCAKFIIDVRLPEARIAKIAELKRETEALCAELQRKDAALKEALEFLPTEGEMRDEASLNEGRASRAGIVGAHVRAALQPKEPPCKT